MLNLLISYNDTYLHTNVPQHCFTWHVFIFIIERSSLVNHNIVLKICHETATMALSHRWSFCCEFEYSFDDYLYNFYLITYLTILYIRAGISLNHLAKVLPAICLNFDQCLYKTRFEAWETGLGSIV